MEFSAFTSRAETSASQAANRVRVQPPPIVPKKSPVPHFRFSTLDFPPKEQFEVWRQSYAPIVDLIRLETCSTDFFGEQELWDLGSLVFSSVKTDGLAFASRDGYPRRPIDYWVISLILKGSSKTVTQFRTFEGPMGAVQIHPLGKAWKGALTDSELLQLFVPRDFFRGMTHLLDGAEFSARDDTMAMLLAGFMSNLARCLPYLDVEDLSRLGLATRTMILACIAPTHDHLNEAGDLIANTLLQRARHYIQANILSPDLGPTSLQRELHISRSRLYRLFESYGGVVHYIQHRRLLDAHAALADPNDRRRIGDIAEERRFSGPAEFSHAFKREFGYSPSEVRGGGKQSPANVPIVDRECVAPGEQLGTLLRRVQAS